MEKNTKEVTVFVDVKETANDSSEISLIKIITVKGKDTITNTEYEIMDGKSSIDSIVNASKSAAMKDLGTSNVPSCCVPKATI
jgi:hypothetical protein